MQSPKEEKKLFHAVKKGETLYSLSRFYSVSVESILKANPYLKNDVNLPVGILLSIPIPEETQKQQSETRQKISSNYRVNNDGQREVKQNPSIIGLKEITVVKKQTVYSILKETGWTEEQFYHYNPQVRNGLKVGQAILIPDISVKNNKAYQIGINELEEKGSNPFDEYIERSVVLLALPFSKDTQKRFSDYYEGFLMALLEAKNNGQNYDLYVVDTEGGAFEEDLRQLHNLPKLDLVIGGVSKRNIKYLSMLASQKKARYIIPFSSKSIPKIESPYVYQINTPHNLIYKEASKKFLSYFSDHQIHFLNFPYDGLKDKKEFIEVLKDELKKNKLPFSESNSSDLGKIMKELNRYEKDVVIIPSSASLANTQLLINAIISSSVKEVEEKEVRENSRLTVFGYPEWQTYAGKLRDLFHSIGATFYTTFFSDPASLQYKSFEKDFLFWYGHGLGTSYPRYTILGYDTGSYFLRKNTNEYFDGIQSRFQFQPETSNSTTQMNKGVFLVQYEKNGSRIHKIL